MDSNFDRDNKVHMRILEHFTTLFVGDMLFHILFNLTDLVGVSDEESFNNKSPSLSQHESVGSAISTTYLNQPLNKVLTDLLLDIFSFYSTTGLPDSSSVSKTSISQDYTLYLPFIIDLFDKAKEIWSRNFGLISQFYFEECYKMLQKVMIDDLNNEEYSETANLKLQFYKYL